MTLELALLAIVGLAFGYSLGLEIGRRRTRPLEARVETLLLGLESQAEAHRRQIDAERKLAADERLLMRRDFESELQRAMQERQLILTGADIDRRAAEKERAELYTRLQAWQYERPEEKPSRPVEVQEMGDPSPQELAALRADPEGEGMFRCRSSGEVFESLQDLKAWRKIQKDQGLPDGASAKAFLAHLQEG